MTRPGFTLVLLAIGSVAIAQPKPATVVVRDESVPTARRLTEAAEKATAGKHAEAVADLQRILDAAGDDLVPATAEHLVPARWLVHRQLTALPKDQLRLYRDRIDEPARVLLTRGKADRDPVPLRQLVARYFVSRSAPEALLLLGDLAFERGDYRRAEGYWKRLLPGDAADELVCPDPPADPAGIRARIVLARIFQGDLPGAKRDLESLEKDFPTATGRLAGTTGPYADTLQSLLDHPPVPTADPPARTWPTFGGDASRSGFAPGAPFRVPVVPTWVAPIPKAAGAAVHASPGSIARSPPFHPVIANGYAYLAEAGRVLRFDLHTGTAAVVYDLRRSDDIPESRSVRADDAAVPPPYDADFALTADGDRIFARLGNPAVRPGGEGADPNPRSTASVLVRFGPPEKPNPDGPPLERQWSAKPPRDGAAWEGAPVVTAGRVLAAYVRTEGDRVIHSVACYPDGAAAPAWARDVADAPAADSDTPRNRHELLTLAGDTVVYCTHSGAVVALNVITGKPAWAVRYLRAKTAVQDYRYRGACPPVAAGGRVFVAPTDAEEILALDAETGTPLWRVAGLRVHSLIGVAGTKLIAAIAGPVRGVRAFDVATGADADRGGWRNHDDPYLSTFGHGVVGNTATLWPTPGGLFPLAHADGFLAAPPVAGPQGNLAFADGVLIVATPIEVRGYVLDPVKQACAVPAPPALKVIRAEVPWKGTFPVIGPEKLPPAVPTRVSKTVPIPRVDGLFLVPFSADPPLAATDSGRVYRIDGDRPVALGEVGFRPTAVQPGPTRDEAILAGPSGLARIRLAGGVTWSVGATEFALNHFAFGESRIVARAGEHHLVAFDAGTGENLWIVDASGRTGFRPDPLPTAPRFSPFVLVDDSSVIAHVTTGRTVRLDGRTGRVVRDEAAGPGTWPTPPVPVEGDGVVLATGPDAIAAVEWRDNRVRWLLRVGREASLTGELPAVRAVDGHVAVAVKRNLGVDLHLVRPEGGQVWDTRPAFLPGDRFDIRSIDADATNLYCPHDDRLTAVRIDDGSEAWTVSLPATHGSATWVARAGAGAVIVWPTHAIPEEPVDTVARRVGRSFLAWPEARRVAGLSETLYEGWAARTVPVLVLDPERGREVRRFELPAVGPYVAVNFTPGAGTTVVTGTKVYTLE